ncbi:MAG: hypothetical protein DRI90_01400 [Deltaproteobacteria bacterium]|nr:MAG: hypothetical protein DRI90_01400 [Deltaproteobacteria bacterium]
MAGCPAAALGTVLGRDHLLIGGSMDDSAFAAEPFDLRYQYLAGNVPTGGPCSSCATGCTVDGASCANNEGCAWWGCWQYDQEPPGRFVADFLAEAAQGGAVPMISTYIWYSVAGDVEGQPEIAALTDGSRVSAYLADFRFLCEVMAEDSSIPSILHLEPDLWGYGQQLTDDPESLPVALSAAGEPACAGLPDTFGGLARCLIAIADTVAPHVLIGFHASAWGAGADALSSDDPQLDVVGHAQQTASFMQALGADQGDLIVVEMSDRDAGFNDRWWDATDVTLPHFARAIEWVDALGNGLDLASLWWQVPYGHMGLPNVCDQYEDNRVDYVFDHPERFAAGGALGVAFGAGAGCMTTPAMDGGHFVNRAAEYYQSERPLLCGD